MNYNYAERYVKKEKPIEAFHYRTNYTDYRDLERFLGDALLGLDQDYKVVIKTLEGRAVLYDDCYIVKNQTGTFCQYKPEIFEEIYRKVDDTDE